jgi:hypothetical protein
MDEDVDQRRCDVDADHHQHREKEPSESKHLLAVAALSVQS